MLDVVDSTIPGVQLHGTDLNQSEQARQIVDPEPDPLPPARFSMQFVHARRNRGQRSLVIERSSSRNCLHRRHERGSVRLDLNRALLA